MAEYYLCLINSNSFGVIKAKCHKPDYYFYNAFITGLSNANKVIAAFNFFEEARLKGCKIHVKSCIVILDELHRAENI